MSEVPTVWLKSRQRGKNVQNRQGFIMSDGGSLTYAPNHINVMKLTTPLSKTIRAAKFLVIGPLVLGFLMVINLLTSPGHWWVQWPALGIGIAWVVCLIRVLFAVALVGGLAAFVALLRNNSLR